MTLSDNPSACSRCTFPESSRRIRSPRRYETNSGESASARRSPRRPGRPPGTRTLGSADRVDPRRANRSPSTAAARTEEVFRSTGAPQRMPEPQVRWNRVGERVRPTSVRAGSRAAVAMIACVTAAVGCSRGSANIEWQQFVEVGAREYVLVSYTDGIAATLGTTVGTVRHTVAGNVDDPNYRPRDGDAAYLAPGTTLRAVNGFATWFRVGTRSGDQVDVYQLDAPPGTAGPHAFDLRPTRIRALEIRSARDGSVLHRVAASGARAATGRRRQFRARFGRTRSRRPCRAFSALPTQTRRP